MKSDLDFLNAGKWMNAAGTAGFFPSRGLLNHFPEIALFITNPISYYPRKPATQRNIIPFQGGFMVHTGHPNPGLRKVIHQFRENWENAILPVCVNVLSDEPYNIEKIVRSLENIENIAAIELGIDHSLKVSDIEANIQAVMGELPIILSLPFEFVFREWLGRVLSPEIVAVSVQAPRGVLKHNGQYFHGRLYGRSIFPLTLHAVQHLTSFEKPIYAGVGVLQESQISSLLEIGAHNFQGHELIWRDNI
jgi:dihydroorotate dehydrogenase